MVKQITNHLTNCPSYLKKGDEWLSDYFGCSVATIRRIKKSLNGVKRNYIASLG